MLCLTYVYTLKSHWKESRSPLDIPFHQTTNKKEAKSIIITKLASVTPLWTGHFIIVLAKVPALSCRLGHVPYDHAFGILMDGCAPYDRAFGALIVRSLSITKKLN